ncbi:MAG TPA: mandelate racemase/muconate lactonizing enzyme family protein [Planctomycetaceae bacterium]|nr:mandelate racemase/muconate lactonizing enzyme family protein [Planctomycetaceae bacterium]
MKITNVRACQPDTPETPRDWRRSMGQILVAIETDSGLTGYGVGGGGLAGLHVVRTVLRDVLLDRDPNPIESLWGEMYRVTIMFGRKGLAVMALSGVDLALWDLKGKLEGVSVTALLGGKPGQTFPVYNTFWHELPPEQIEPFSAVKLHLGRSAGGTAELIESIHKARAVAGPDRELMLDAWMQWDLDTTLAIAHKTADCNLGWIEEPLPIDDVDGYRRLAAESPVPIAGGEHEYTEHGFRLLRDLNLHQVWQPDVNWCGGLTQLIKIYELARESNLRVVPHRGAELWSLPALSALDPSPLAESGRPWMSWVGGQPSIESGTVTVPDRPGFGVEIDEDGLICIA